MSDKPVVHIGENSPEHVALELMRKIASVEQRILHYSSEQPERVADRKWILDAYAECLHAVRGYRDHPSN